MSGFWDSHFEILGFRGSRIPGFELWNFSVRLGFRESDGVAERRRVRVASSDALAVRVTTRLRQLVDEVERHQRFDEANGSQNQCGMASSCCAASTLSGEWLRSLPRELAASVL